MASNNHIKQKRTKFKNKKSRVNYKIKSNSDCPRLVIFRSNLNIYGQLVDNKTGSIILAGSSIDKDLKKEISKCNNKIEQSNVVGKKISNLIKSKKIGEIVFDRNGYKYHGRIKVLADTIREDGVKF